MRRIYMLVGLASAIAITLVGTAAAKPAPTFTAQLTDDGACTFTVTASWKNANVDTVYGMWYLDDPSLTTSFLTTQAPPVGNGIGSLTGKTAIMKAGAFSPGDGVSQHTWQVRLQFYYKGAQVNESFTNVDTAVCTVGA